MSDHKCDYRSDGGPCRICGKTVVEQMSELPAPAGSAATFFVTQDLVDEIVRRAKASSMGLGAQENPVILDNYAKPHTTETLAILLVSAWTEKYDIVSVFAAALDVIKEKQHNDKSSNVPPKT